MTAYRYGLFDKVAQVTRPDGSTVSYTYDPVGQVAQKLTRAAGEQKPRTESFLWDGLALLERDGTRYTVQPHASGGVPLSLSEADQAPATVVTDPLGTTLGTLRGDQFEKASLSAFGEPAEPSGDHALFYTGKPWDGDLQAYQFLFRQYQPGINRWTAQDPSGFPDGPNPWLYVSNNVTAMIDPLGLATVAGKGIPLYGTAKFLGNGPKLTSIQVTKSDGSGNPRVLSEIKATWEATVEMMFVTPFSPHETMGATSKTASAKVSVSKTINLEPNAINSSGSGNGLLIFNANALPNPVTVGAVPTNIPGGTAEVAGQLYTSLNSAWFMNPDEYRELIQILDGETPSVWDFSVAYPSSAYPNFYKDE